MTKQSYINKYVLLTYGTTILHFLLSIYILLSGVLALTNFYFSHRPLLIIWTITQIIVQLIYKKCPLTTIDKWSRIKHNAQDKKYETSFNIYWIYKITGIKLSPKLIDYARLVTSLLLIITWIRILVLNY